MHFKRYDKALVRNINEIGRAILERKALLGIEAADSYHTFDFFKISYDAMFNDMISHAIKVFDLNNRSTSFWYLYRCNSGIVDTFIKRELYEIEFLKNLSVELKHIRDNTHFHIDEDAVFDPKKIWDEAGITGKELAKGIDTVWEILQHLHQNRFGKIFNLPEYDGSDVTQIIIAARNVGVLKY